jgi:hypothetical protein
MTEKASTSGIDVSESIGTMRIEIIDATSNIATAAPRLKTTAEDFQTEMLDTVSRFEADIGKEQELLSIEALYRPVTPEAKTTTVVRIFDILHEYGDYLQNALAGYDYEGVREHEMTLFHPMVFEFDYVPVSDNFRDIITALKLALNSNSQRPFTRPQIVALKKVVDTLKKTLDVSDTIMDEIIDLLSVHFNLAGPLAEGVCLE